jgi:hypothetical protein
MPEDSMFRCDRLRNILKFPLQMQHLLTFDPIDKRSPAGETIAICKKVSWYYKSDRLLLAMPDDGM